MDDDIKYEPVDQEFRVTTDLGSTAKANQRLVRNRPIRSKEELVSPQSSNNTPHQQSKRGQAPTNMLVCQFCLTHKEKYPSVMARHTVYCRKKYGAKSPEVSSKMVSSYRTGQTANADTSRYNSPANYIPCKYCGEPRLKSHMQRHYKTCEVRRNISSGRDTGRVPKKSAACVHCTRYQSTNPAHMRKHQMYCKARKGTQGLRPKQKASSKADQNADIGPLSPKVLHLNLPNLSLQALTEVNKESNRVESWRTVNSDPKHLSEQADNHQSAGSTSRLDDALFTSDDVRDSDSESDELDFVCPYKDLEMHGDREVAVRHLESHCWYCAYCGLWLNGFQSYSDHFALCQVNFTFHGGSIIYFHDVIESAANNSNVSR